MKKWVRKLGKWAVGIYIAQALVGASVGAYFAITTDRAEIERIISCVAY